MTQQKFGVSGSALKCIAMASMLTDHIGYVLFPQYLILRMIGRLAFPIYCFLLVEGAMHTGNIRKYEIRLLAFALISELPFDYAFYGGIRWESQNVFFTLLFGVLAIDLAQQSKNKLMVGLIFVLMVAAAEVMGTDYGGAGIVFIFCYYLLYDRKIWKQIIFAAENLVLYGVGIQACATFAVVPMLLYNGKKGASVKYLFYAFYPSHLLILYLIIRMR